MKWWVTVAVVMTAVSIAEAAEPGQPRTIDLQIRSDARVPTHILRDSQDVVTQIFATAGLIVRWTDTAPQFTVTIVPQVLGYARASSSVMGVARRSPDGLTVQVFFRQVQDFARTYRVDLSIILAHVIAHEVGHLLLPGGAHSPTGLMQAGWDRALASKAVRDSLTFTEAEASRMRASR